MALLAPLLSGCWCLLHPCDGGFGWSGKPVSGVVEPGVYRFTVTVEHNASFELECEITSTSTVGDCDRWRDAEDSQFDVSLHPGLLDEPQSGPVGGFSIGVMADDGKNVIGPRHVSIEVTRDGALLADVDYEVEYIRDREYWGEPHCGFCDRGAELQSHTW
ncbi:hypothetical protein [Enhygromyxa salina]|uniref:hypothetical protein n=1 Tax=Enhygromyxa salina TaxID=215803 RepID=UPI0004E6C828|nr:hypothetical protein [Enhygromyxa salina]